MAHDAAIATTHPASFLEERGRFTGILSWIFSTDHKRIGILYLFSLLAMFLVGATFAFLMRLELIAPGKTIIEPQTYNSFFTLHGVIMIFLFLIPSIPAAFGNFFLPIQIGAKDVAFPRLNLLSWWLYISGAALAIYSLVSGAAPADTGWTFMRRTASARAPMCRSPFLPPSFWDFLQS